MKKLIGALGILSIAGLLAACGPDMKSINDSTSKAEASATRSDAAANNAEAAAAQSDAADRKAEEAATAAEASVSKANDSIARLEAAFATSVTK
jgi:ABC-type transporter Mla subunit MlaD